MMAHFLTFYLQIIHERRKKDNGMMLQFGLVMLHVAKNKMKKVSEINGKQSV
jgi:hypothetical protein